MAKHNIKPPPPVKAQSSESKDESNLCRICRGEATEEEPLYHPCKCSGSIMYVHQECLMEWLSHSQKKHCELCKTSFRFTKLYSPEMPESLPTGIFIRKAATHTANNLVYWARGCLVFWTWAMWLPWTMRFVWWGLFWLTDVGWVKSSQNLTANATQFDILNETSGHTMLEGPGSPLQGDGPAVLRMASWFFRVVLSNPGRGVLPELNPDNHMQSQLLELDGTQLAGRATLFSSIDLLTNLTPSPTMNRVVIDILEGNIIALALVSLIILILLIREWVVQQQPVINLANDVGEPAEPPPQPQPNAGNNRRHRPLRTRRRTSILARGTDDFVKAILEEQRQQNKSEISLVRAEETYIRALFRRVLGAKYKFTNQILQRVQADDIVPLSADESDALDILNDVKETATALRIVYANAVDQEDLERLRSVRASLYLFRRILLLLPQELVRPTSEGTNEMKASFKSMFPMVKLKKTITFRGHRESENQSTEQGPLLEEHEPRSLSHEGFDGRDETPQGRPTMPPREESFVATSIQRDLEENTNVDADPEVPRTVESGSEVDSTSSANAGEILDIDSYENIERVTEEAIRQSLAASSALADNANQDPEAASSSSAHSQSQTSNSDAAGHDPVPSSHDAQASQNNVVPGSHSNEVNEELAATTPVVNDAQTIDHPEASRKSVTDRLADWLWGDLDRPENGSNNGDEVVNVQDQVTEMAGQDAIEHETPQEPVGTDQGVAGPLDDTSQQAAAEAQPPNPAEPAEQAQDQAPALFGDIDAMDDAEDLEGIMELIGMQGQLTGLLTNAMFASVFVSCIIVISVWFPFLVGKLVLMMLAHPISVVQMPLLLVNFLTNLGYDVLLLMAGSTFKWTLLVPAMYLFNNWYNVLPISLAHSGFLSDLDVSTSKLIRQTASRLADTLQRTVEGTNVAYSTMTFDSHTAVRTIESLVNQVIQSTIDSVQQLAQHFLSFQDLLTVMSTVKSSTSYALTQIGCLTKSLLLLPSSLASGNLQITFAKHNSQQTSAIEAPQWTAIDRSIAIALGYGFVTLLGAVYFMRLAPLARSRPGRKIEGIVMEILQQAGGIAKVVLIISIEMLVFPLYCGMLLDIAMLPLFANTGIADRILWTQSSPWTSLFTHWFLGTAYMFHFALFVAMCRKIFRKGVLFFIRDPDDPSFHPVRDVLERSVVSQLRKILSSAMIYGGLVIICIGALVWGLSLALSGLLPIQWRPTGAANAFPFDLVAYICLRPIVVQHFALSEWLQEFYHWFFRRSARHFRLTQFLFGHDFEDERGPIERRGFSMQPKNGKWLRVPASDRVRIPQGIKAFVDVDQYGKRLDGASEPEYPEGRSFKEEDYRKVFVPHFFKLHLAAFIVCLWSMTATVGLLFTLLPLMVGRLVLVAGFGRNAAINDIYAFSIGIVVTCGLVLSVVKVQKSLAHAYEKISRSNSPPLLSDAQARTSIEARLYAIAQLCLRTGPRLSRCLCFYGILGGTASLMLAAVIHFYIFNPISALMNEGQQPYVIKISESLVLGMQAIRIISLTLRDHEEWRSTRALNAALQDGPFHPKVALATRYLFLPFSLFCGAALLLPAAAGLIAQQLVQPSNNKELKRAVQIFAYPTLLGLLAIFCIVHALIQATSRWRLRIRDEVFLIGERLHNYGERKPPANARHSKARL